MTRPNADIHVTDSIPAIEIEIGDIIQTSIGAAEVDDIHVSGPYVAIGWEGIDRPRSGQTEFRCSDVIDVER